LLLGKAGEDPGTLEEFLTESKTQLERLEWITVNLLSLSRLDAGLTTLNKETLNVSEFIESVIVPFKIQAQSEGKNLIINSPEPHLRIIGDRKLLELALSNLLDNALKFTSSGDEVEVGADKDESQIQLWVRDTGPGIPPNELQLIFERFYRGRNAKIEGSGLGLAMVKSVVIAHGGEVQVISEPEMGSEFRIIFPVETNEVNN
jgi:signal transduction histidine kinase